MVAQKAEPSYRFFTIRRPEGAVVLQGQGTTLVMREIE
jgi:hypothetical protein